MVFNDPIDDWSHLRDDSIFRTYADERLAMLYLQNVGDFPIDLLIKVFDVILDPLFKLEDITFKSVWGIFDYISDYRKRVTPARADNEITHIAPQETHAYSVPPLAMSLVIDRMMEDRKPLGTITKITHWRDAYESDVEDFHSMSLVHPTWTPIARRALQHRVVIPHYQTNRFLLSPLCEPWVTEMVVYWSINNGFWGATPGDVNLFQALLERMPRLQSLAFVTDLDRHGEEWEVHCASSLQFSRCLQLISDMAPKLENLWLKHYWQWQQWQPESEAEFPPVDEDDLMISLTASLRTCDDVDALPRLLSNLRSLKFFSMHSWNTLEQVHIERHPKLEKVEVHDVAHDYYSGDVIKSLYFSRATGGELIKASGLSCGTIVLEQVPASELSGLAKLELHDGYVSDLPEDLHHCTSLVHLKLSYYRIIHANIMHLFPSHALDSRITRDFCDHIRSLPRLRRLVLSYYSLPFAELQDLIKSFNHSVFTPPSEQGERTTPLIELCKERGIEFVLESAEGSIRVC